MTWRKELESFGPAGRDVRDPFVWRSAEGAERMLVAHPGAWESADLGEASFLSLWTRMENGQFDRSGTIGPWYSPGLLWEVPALIDFGSAQALLISLVDRRAGATRCEVRYWLGHMGDCGFDVQHGFPAEGRPLDHGPDFYAAIPNAPEHWPHNRRMIVAWAAQWGRLHPPLQGYGHGGPMTLPRVVTLESSGLHVAPLPEALPLAHWACSWDGAKPCRLSLVSSSGTWHFAFAGDQVDIQHPGGARTAELPYRQGRRTAHLFVDGDLIELFAAGTAFTVRGTLLGIERQ